MRGNFLIFEHTEYTPYGEIWIEDQKQEDLDKTPYRFTSKEWDEETELYYMSARYQDPMTSRWISADPAGPLLLSPDRSGFSIIESVNWYSYTGNNPLKYNDPSGMIMEVGDGLLYNDKNDSYSYRDGRDVKSETNLEITRNSLRGDQNDSAQLKIGDNVISEYSDVQSEKNYRSGDQSRSERHDSDYSDENYPNATLPTGDDYVAEMLGETGSYNDALGVTSDTAQLPGFSQKGIKGIWAFMVHSTGDKNKPGRTTAHSWGCQIFGNKDFADLMGTLRDIGFKKGDSFGMSIKQNNFVEKR